MTKEEAIAKAKAIQKELAAKGIHAHIVVDPDPDEFPADDGPGIGAAPSLSGVAAQIASLAEAPPDAGDTPAVAVWLDKWDAPAQAVAQLYQQHQVTPDLHAAWVKGKSAVAGVLESMPPHQLELLALYKGFPHPGLLAKHLGLQKAKAALVFALNPFYRASKKAPLIAKAQELFQAAKHPEQVEAIEAKLTQELKSAVAALKSPGKIEGPAPVAAPGAGTAPSTPAAPEAFVAWDVPSAVPTLTHRERILALESILLQRRAAGALPAWRGADAIRQMAFQHVRSAGDLGGVHAKHIYRDKSGTEWLFKPDKHGGAVAHAEAAAAAVSRRAGLPTIETAVVALGGKVGSIQPMIQGAKPLPQDPAKWSPAQLQAVLTCHVVDWLLGDHDGHPANFLVVGEADADRVPVRIDRGQAFKFFGQDRLDLDYEPNAKHGAPPHAAILAYRAWKSGKVRVDPHAVYPAIRAVQSIPDEEYKAMLRPLAEAGARSSDKDCAWRPRAAKVAEEQLGRKPKPHEIADAFLDMAVERKRNVKRDLEALFSQVLGVPFTFGSGS